MDNGCYILSMDNGCYIPSMVGRDTPSMVGRDTPTMVHPAIHHPGIHLPTMLSRVHPCSVRPSSGCVQRRRCAGEDALGSKLRLIRKERLPAP